MVADEVVLGAGVCTVAVPVADREGKVAPAAVDVVVYEAAPAFACVDESRLAVVYSGYTSYSPA